MYTASKLCSATKSHPKYYHYALHAMSSSFHKPQLECHYATLGVERHASDKDIRAAYIRMAKKYHPDISAEHDSTRKFSSINEAYSILSDKSKKHQYDALIRNHPSSSSSLLSDSLVSIDLVSGSLR